MAFNPNGATQLPVSQFGGLVTFIPPANVPKGSSPDNQDVEFVPGAVYSRRALLKVFSTPFGTVTATWGKSYTDPQGVVHNLWLDSAGNYWEQNSPTTFTMVNTTIPGSYAKSTTAFGREYIAASNGIESTDVAIQFDGTNFDRVTQDGPGANPTVQLLTYAGVAISTLSRVGDLVAAVTGAAHNLQPGYRVQIKGTTPTDQGAGIATITIANTQLPGIATVVTNSPHQLQAGAFINIQDVANHIVGTSISKISRQGQVVTVETSTPHGLSSGALITTDLVTNTSFNASFVVQQILDPLAFVYNQADVDATDTTGVIRVNWPLPQTTTPSFFQVQSIIDASTFTILLNYTDGVWISGTVSFPWDGFYFVQAILSATSFTYTQVGTTGSESVTITGGETATPQGQLSIGIHQMFTMFLTRQLYLTRPSNPVQLESSGGQYVKLTDIPIGPSNVIARIFGFTGAGGSRYFYLPVAPQINGDPNQSPAPPPQLTGTTTQINDNTTTTAIIDFGDNDLFAGVGLSIPGNDVRAQIILDGALGFGYFGSRLITWGQRNTIQNFINLGFDGGHLPSASTKPAGWKVTGSAGGSLATGHYGQGWQIGGSGSISQGAYQDAYGTPILTPNTPYSLRAWIKGAGGTITMVISSASTGFSSTVTLTGTSATGSFIQGNFSAATPAAIPLDMIITLTGTGTPLIDDICFIYSDKPFQDKDLYGSYEDNPEAFDGLTGKFGANNDTRKAMGIAMIRDSLYLLTQDPGGRLHSITNTSVTEPVGWVANEVSSMCGLLSIFGLTVSQADDNTGAGGEEWMAWASSSGARIFGGDTPWKMSEEIQPNWDTINMGSAQTIWAMNDSNGRVIYFGLPIGTATAPNQVFPVNYKTMNTAAQIGNADPVHSGPGGDLFYAEQSRKWTRWNMKANGMVQMLFGGQLTTIVFGGTGATPLAAGFGNIYFLCGNKFTDDDYGQIFPYYTTYFFPADALAQQLGLGAQRHMLAFMQWLASGLGYMQVTAYVNNLSNPWTLQAFRNLVANPNFDATWPGANVTGERIAFQFASFPGSV